MLYTIFFHIPNTQIRKNKTINVAIQVHSKSSNQLDRTNITNQH